ncbi:chloride channel protein [Ahrensia sp. R2A130]|uniref:chloride channel protein n=1 Tax=Ahrensia sp. R2A130 TaxID=744979 RepID=UPI0001E0C31B|nr:chloride channel protein [Ahrensia sp. R2A130]EFL90787.1 Cl- channel, voltage gated [Ahrensia sp. R2A130]
MSDLPTRFWNACRNGPSQMRGWVRPNVQFFMDSKEPQLWLISLAIGLLVSIAAVAFREAIGLVQLTWLGVHTETVTTAAREIHWLWILLTPCIGGLFIGWLLDRFVAGRRTGGVADVIEAKAHGGRNIEIGTGLWSAAISALSLGFGASAGREGPLVHLGGAIATSLCQLFTLPVWSRRTLLACGVASAVSASFNAPIAGVLFAHEVILGHYSKRSFIPIVISSVMGTILTRLWFGDAAAFSIPEYQITSYLEFPAFALLGVVCGMVAVIFQMSLIQTDRAARAVPMPLWLRPAVGGLMVGAIGVFYPEILGVGYEATDMALKNQFTLPLLLALIVWKTAATSITLASRFGGGIFSPSLYIGAMVGGAFGLIASQVFPELASSQGLYAILGMGAVAAAVLGAPISTLVMVFELTGGYTLSIALLLTVSIAVGINQALHGRSYFQWQLEMRGMRVTDGPHRFMVRNTMVASFMAPLAEDDDPAMPDEEDLVVLRPDDTLEAALRTFDESGLARLPVRDATDATKIVGWATQVAALRTYNTALVDMSVEEHR